MDCWRRGKLALVAAVFGAIALVGPGSVAAQGGGFTCTEVIGYSQTAQWFKQHVTASTGQCSCWSGYKAPNSVAA